MVNQSTMSIDQRLREWLKRNDWRLAGSGALGETWAHSTTAGSEVRGLEAGDSEMTETPKIAVPFSFQNDMHSYNGVIERLSHWARQEVTFVKDQIELWDIDVSHFAAEVNLEKYYGRETAPLHTVSHLFSGTGKIFRAAAQTSIAPKEVINNFSSTGEVIYQQVHAGFTENGSYSLPIYVAVGNPLDAETSGDRAMKLPVPSTKRKVTETVAKALFSVHKNIIIPEKAPSSRERINDLVQSGVSKELLNAIADLLGDGETNTRSEFAWAPSHAELLSSRSLPTKIEFPHDSKALIEEVSKLFKQPDPEPEAMDGQITGILLSEATVTTIMSARRYSGSTSKRDGKGRKTTIEVIHNDVPHRQLDEFFRWMKEGTRVFFSGSVKKNSNRLQVSSPPTFMIQDGLLDSQGKAETWAIAKREDK